METPTITSLLKSGADSDIAIAAPGRKPMTYQGLRRQIENTVTALNKLGIGRNDPVAIVLPNGPEMASAFVAIASCATTAPLNPAYRQQEFEFYLRDLGAKLLVVDANEGLSPARAAAKELGIAIADLHASRNDPAGRFRLVGEPITATGSDTGFASSEETALVLHTSGTTSGPKMVPLSHANLCASARNVARSLALVPEDCCLNIMPLFHIHGLVAAVLASFSVGASIYCTPGFNALKFFAWMKEANPTWYTAVPTMHQAILERANQHADLIAAGRIRFVRSSSASLAPAVMRKLEQTFHAPVIEAYGMTEAAHQMASNPLPPHKQKPGTVGLAAGPDVAVMGEGGTLLPAGSIGEVVIRGANVTTGYGNNPKANAEAFVDGWFRTGDQGVIDEEGYLRLTGRLKEIINRGGEKISPREVDEVLLEHPAVKQAVTFAMPHEKLGEEVAVAIILKEEAFATKAELRNHARQRLAEFKVPRKVVILKEIPKGPTGKLQRIGLAEKLGLG